MQAQADNGSRAGVVLAGGRSSRMGREKALLVVEGSPLWRRGYDLLASAGATERFVSVRPDQDWLPRDMPAVFDTAPALGPLGGVTAALARCSADHLLVLAVDLPKMTTVWFARLLSLCGAGVGAVGVHGASGRYEPLAAIYPKSLLPLAQEALARGELSLQALMGRAVAAGSMRAEPITGEDVSWFENWNEPADVAHSDLPA